jgi:pyrroline-5-carboxylate reductase
MGGTMHHKDTIDCERVLLIGAGKMGSALLGAWLRCGLQAAAVTVVETNADAIAALQSTGVRIIASLQEAPDDPQCIVLAVKPQSLAALLPTVAEKYAARPLYLSIAAGKTLGFYQQALGGEAAVVRAMPNTPALVRKGISALCANALVSERQRTLAASLLKAAGEVLWLEDEAQMDAVTALSGSGPAYVFLFLEALIAAGKAQGLSEDIAAKLALHTLRGSAKLAMKSAEPLAQLRTNVTSPGGTTEAALKVLMQGDAFALLINDAVREAVKRAKELA